ncbi:Mitochondrial import inner membrane translocase subunit TIM10 [Leucoagaricus sp. SymC.cos]|nr:Mitochondrial import inner membrane translocase subunit TIM10 [Leucoagaricus sp. SymC.cos]
MSFLGGGRSPAPAGGMNSEKVEMAITELDTVTDFFNRMVLTLHSFVLTTFFRSCHAKCISTRYADGELNKGESVCVDRCVAKFNEVQKKVGEKLQSRSQANATPGGSAGGFGAF